MQKPKSPWYCLALTAAALGATVVANASEGPAYQDASLSAEARARDLVSRLTIEEKASQLVNQSRAVPRLNIPDYDWWSEALHGAMREGTTVFPEPVGLAATFDPPAVYRMAVAIGTEARIIHLQGMRDGHSDIFEGLDFWAPNINIFRDPRWGRGQETYGEDPFLTAQLGVQFVKGLQGDDARYYRAISTPKHFAVHSGPESTRHLADVQVSKHDELDTYLPAFRATVTEGKAASVMCAYNSINGQPACVNEFLLQDQLRGKWHFNGYVVSDCEAIVNIHRDHHFTATQPEASALAIQRGMDNECVDFAQVPDDHDYRPYLEAFRQGILKAGEIDTALVRLFTARMKLGLFDPPALVPYTKIDARELDSARHRALALELASESMVLLKNDGTLPLNRNVRKITVVGPLAEQRQYLYGNYNGTPTRSVSVLEALKAEFPRTQISFVAGTQFLSKAGDLVPAAALSTADGQAGLEAEFSSASAFENSPAIIARARQRNVNWNSEALPPQAVGKTPLRVDWKGFITPDRTAEYSIGVRFDSGFAKVAVDGKDLASGWAGGGALQTRMGHLHLEKARKVAIEVRYAANKAGHNHVQLIWSRYDPRPDPAAIKAAKRADLVVAVMGITSELEGEEMPVNEPGFDGGDRTSLDLPKPEAELLQALTAAGKPVVLVLANGSALAVNWANEHVNAILESWYPGEEGGTAVAQTLSGKNNPAGRLPVTFYTGVDQLPPFGDYAMKARTYRYFEGKPLYPFGYGLSYTTFAYQGLRLPEQSIQAGEALSIEATVTNTGKRAGDEVAQLYLSFPSVAGAPLRALRGLKRIHLQPGESTRVEFALRQRDMSVVTEQGEIVIAAGRYTAFVGGGQPGTVAPVVQADFDVHGTLRLPE